MHPTAVAEHGLRRFAVAPVAVEQVGRAHQDLTVFGELHLDALGDRADVAGARKRPALAGDDAARRLGLSVHLDDIDAQHVPHRHGLGRQRRAAGGDQLELVEADLVEDGPEHQSVPGRVRDLGGRVHCIGPAALHMSSGEGHGAVVGEALEAGGAGDANEQLRGQLLQVARHREQHCRRRLEQRRRQVLDTLAQVRNELRYQRQGDSDIAAQHMAERQIGDRAVRLLAQRWILRRHRTRRRQVLAVGH